MAFTSCSTPATVTSPEVLVSVSGMKTALALDFVPRPQDVIVGRQGRSTKAHNVHFTSLIEAVADEYSQAINKASKSRILLGVVNQVQNNGGMFVRRDLSTGRWYMVENAVARTTAAQLMRDSLHENYKSSRQFKQQRRQQQEPIPLQQKSSTAATHDDTAMNVPSFTVLQAASLGPPFLFQVQQPEVQVQPRHELRKDSSSFSFPSFVNDYQDNIAMGSFLDFPSLLSAGVSAGDGVVSSIQDSYDDDNDEFNWNFDLLFNTKNIQQQPSTTSATNTAATYTAPTTTVVPDDSSPSSSNLFSILSSTFGQSSDGHMLDENPFEPTPISLVVEEVHLANGLDELISREF